jgi:hypothetical protein
LVDIILVHGLGGHPTETWTAQNGSFWPAWLKGDGFERVRLITFGYDAAPAPTIATNVLGLREFAGQLRFVLGQHYEPGNVWNWVNNN